MADPAKVTKKTKRELMNAAREACRRRQCYAVDEGFPTCPFCPYWNKVLKNSCPSCGGTGKWIHRVVDGGVVGSTFTSTCGDCSGTGIRY